MNEIITANGVNYTIQNLTTTQNTISFTVQGLTTDEAENVFRGVKFLTVGADENTIYGEYPNIVYESLTKDADNNITITMHIPSKMELQISELQKSQAEQDEAIATIMFGGELQ